MIKNARGILFTFAVTLLWLLPGIAAENAPSPGEDRVLNDPRRLAVIGGSDVEAEESIPRQNPFEGMIPETVKVYVVSAYSGEKTAIQIDDSGHATTVLRITVNSPDTPAALILSAYEPGVWQIGWTPETEICAVVASGNYRQIVRGLPDGIPVLTIQGGYHRLEGRGADELIRLSKRYFNRAPAAAVEARRGENIVGRALRTGEYAITAREFVEKDFHRRDAPLAGEKGLEEAVEKKLLRKATSEDLAEWRRMAREKGGKAADGTSMRPLRGFRTYVVLSPDFVIPAGLAGAHSATFFLPPGISMPKGPRGHCTFYFMKDGTAIGPGMR